jgi:hypothetical protein
MAAILMMLPLGALGLIAAGGVAVALYRRKDPGTFVSAGMGARLGAATGALGFGMFVILGAVQMAVLHTGDEFRKTLLDAVQQAAARSSDPQAQQAVEYLKTPAGLAVMMILGLAAVLVICLILSAVGGALGAAWLGRKRTL